jgi:RimJ/RimL family protein N-acetyltransferase
LAYKEGHLSLVEPNLEHAEISLFWTSDSSVIQYMGADFDLPSKEKEIERINEIRENRDEYNWMIELDGHVIGNVSINSIKETSTIFGSKAGNYTILIGDKKYWGKGIASQVCLSVLEWAFHKGGFEVMAARALNENTASIGMLTKIGFEYTGNSPFEGKIAGKTTEWQNFKITKKKFAQLKAK